MGSTGARALRPPRGRLRRARPRAVRPGARPEDYGYERLAAGPAGGARRPRDRPRRAGRRLDGRAHADGVRARPPRARRRPGDHDPGLRPRRTAARRDGPLGPARRRACASGGVEGFVEAYGTPNGARASGSRRSTASCTSACPPTSTPTRSPTRCRPSRARARSRRWDDLQAIDAPDRDRRQPRRGRPRAPVRRSASATREAIPGARLVSEEPGASPLAWQGAQVSKVISEVAALRQPRHEQQRALDDQLAVVGRREQPVVAVAARHEARAEARAERDLGPRVLQRARARARRRSPSESRSAS